MNSFFRRFTLIEMLVVIAIIGILASLLMPSLQQALESSRTMQCLSNQRQIALSMFSYSDDNGGLLPNKTCWGSTSNGWASNWWVVHVSQYTDKPVKFGYSVAHTIFCCPNYKKTCNLNGTLNGWIGNNYAVNPRIHGSNFAQIASVKAPSTVLMTGDGGIYNSSFCLCKYDQNHYSLRHADQNLIDVAYVDGHAQPLIYMEYITANYIGK